MSNVCSCSCNARRNTSFGHLLLGPTASGEYDAAAAAAHVHVHDEASADAASTPAVESVVTDEADDDADSIASHMGDNLMFTVRCRGCTSGTLMTCQARSIQPTSVRFPAFIYSTASGTRHELSGQPTTPSGLHFARADL